MDLRLVDLVEVELPVRGWVWWRFGCGGGEREEAGSWG